MIFFFIFVEMFAGQILFLFFLDEALIDLTLQAFEKCDNDEISGLSWDEIEKCEEEFCDILTIPCPNKDNFEHFDEDGDGNLTLDEYFEHISKIQNDD